MKKGYPRITIEDPDPKRIRQRRNFGYAFHDYVEDLINISRHFTDDVEKLATFARKANINLEAWNEGGRSVDVFVNGIAKSAKQISCFFWREAGELFYKLPMQDIMFKNPRDEEFGILHNPFVDLNEACPYSYSLECKVCDNKPIGKCCGDVAYCSTKCQEKDWQTHEKDCKRKINNTF